MASDANPARVFISYSHDSPEHEENVLALSNRLRADGINALIDQYETFPPKGWLRWMRQQIEEADFVLAVCTQTYRRRAEGKEVAGKGLGGAYEGSIIDQELYEASGENRRIIPVVLTKEDSDHRPQFLRQYTLFTIDFHYEDLYLLLTNQPKVEKPEIGRLRALPERAKRSDYRGILWNIPPPNDYFSGREGYLQKLRYILTSGQPAALTQAIKGLGGMGKTQTAIQYAFRHRAEYRAGFSVLADLPENLISGFAGLAGLLDLVEKDAKEIASAAAAAKRWFESNDGWLLILDNVEDWNVAKEWIPSGKRGHVLITTRLQFTGKLAQGLDLPNMPQEEGADFLLLRAKISDPSAADRAAALELSGEVGGLPLALEQAGAYIEEAQLSPVEYLELYRVEGKALRAQGATVVDHDTVAVTFTLAFEKLSEPAKNIVRMCAYLAPDAIPEDILSAGQEPDLQFRHAVADAARYSLIQRNAKNQTVDIHRLVQDVVKDSLDPIIQRQWVEQALSALNARFPEDMEFKNWPECERLLPHARIATSLALRYGLESGETAHLMHQTAWYLLWRAQYKEAEPLIRRALEIREEVLGPEHPDTARSLNDLGWLFNRRGQDMEVVPLFTRVLEIREKALGPDHPDTAFSLNNLAQVLGDQGRYEEAVMLFRRALDIRERVLGPEHPDTAFSLNSLGGHFREHGKYDEAEPLLKRALAIREAVLGPQHPSTSNSLHNLGELFRVQGRDKEAELFLRRALEINEKTLGPDHPDTALNLNNLAMLYEKEARLLEAEPLLMRALEINEKTLGPHLETAKTLRNLGDFYSRQGLFHKADPFLRRAFSIAERLPEGRSPKVVDFARSYLTVVQKVGRIFEAQKLRARFQLGPQSPPAKIEFPHGNR